MWFVLSLGSNELPEQQVCASVLWLAQLGELTCSRLYATPPRDGSGPDYWNMAVTLQADLNIIELEAVLDAWEYQRGRRKGDTKVPIDIDLIAAGEDPSRLSLIETRLPLPLDTLFTVNDIWPELPFTLPDFPAAFRPLVIEQERIRQSLETQLSS